MANEQEDLLQPGEQIGIYRVNRRVGAGGMGQVYEAWEDELQRKVAIKILSTRDSKDDEVVQRFKGEGRTLARLKHPHVVGLYYLGEHNGLPYMAMEYIEGLPLDQFVTKHPCGLADLLALFKQMVAGLGAAHESGIIHRDIKPHNIMIDSSLNVKLLDFGIAKVYADHKSVHTSADVLIGTASYFAPEIVVGKLATKQTDIFSLGLVFFTVLAGVNPLEGRSNLETMERIRSKDVTFPPHLAQVLPQQLQQVVLKMTARDPRRRYTGTAEILADLEKVDLAQLPADLRLSVFPRLVLENHTDARRQCAELGFDAAESRFVLSLAAEIQAASEIKTDATQRMETTPKIWLSEQSISEAAKRYRVAKKSMITQRVSAPVHREVPPATGKRQDLLLTAIVLALVIAAIGVLLPRVKGVPSNLRMPAKLPSFGGFKFFELLPGRQTASLEKPDKPLPKANLPQHRPGTTMRYRVKVFRGEDGNVPEFEGKTEWKLAEIKSEHFIWRNESGGEVSQSRNPFVPPFRIVNSALEGNRKNVITGDFLSLFPLATGRKAGFRVISQDLGNGATTDQTMTCQVVAEEKVRVDSGTFDTYRVECATDRPPFTKDTFYYAPQLQHWVLRNQRVENGGEVVRRYYELTGYSLNR